METLLLSPESLAPEDLQPSAADILERLCSLECAYRDCLGDVQNLELPSGVTLDDVLDAVVGLTVAHAIAESDAGHGRSVS
jgi:hypothetical protein